MARLLDLRTPFTPLNPAGALLMLTRFRKFLVLAVIAVMTVTGAGQTLAAERKTTTVHKKQKVAKVATAKKKAVTTKKVRVTKKKTVRKIAKPAAASASPTIWTRRFPTAGWSTPRPGDPRPAWGLAPRT